MSDLENLQRALGHRFCVIGLLENALTHSSMLSRRTRHVESNERLEFVGDRVLGLVIAEMLFERFPDEPEGALAKRHAALVCREALMRVATSINLAPHIMMTKGEEEGGGRFNPGLISDACEAVIAALYRDAGLDVAARFIRNNWAPLIAEDLTPPQDAKTALQEWAQGHGFPLPKYVEVGRDGPAHAPSFQVKVEVETLTPATASGPSKRTAEQAAAQRMLEQVLEYNG